MAGIQNVDAIMKEAEIIEFISPRENHKNLYISNISPSLSEDEIYVSFLLFKSRKFLQFLRYIGCPFFPIPK